MPRDPYASGTPTNNDSQDSGYNPHQSSVGTSELYRRAYDDQSFSRYGGSPPKDLDFPELDSQPDNNSQKENFEDATAPSSSFSPSPLRTRSPKRPSMPGSVANNAPSYFSKPTAATSRPWVRAHSPPFPSRAVGSFTADSKLDVPLFDSRNTFQNDSEPLDDNSKQTPFPGKVLVDATPPWSQEDPEVDLGQPSSSAASSGIHHFGELREPEDPYIATQPAHPHLTRNMRPPSPTPNPDYSDEIPGFHTNRPFIMGHSDNPLPTPDIDDQDAATQPTPGFLALKAKKVIDSMEIVPDSEPNTSAQTHAVSAPRPNILPSPAPPRSGIAGEEMVEETLETLETDGDIALESEGEAAEDEDLPKVRVGKGKQIAAVTKKAPPKRVNVKKTPAAKGRTARTPKTPAITSTKLDTRGSKRRRTGASNFVEPAGDEDLDNVTEPADEEPYTPAPSTRKRKTAATSSSRKPKTPPSPSSTSYVLALWGLNDFYYVGVIVAKAGRGAWKVHFLDGETRDVSLTSIRQCDLRIGDVVEHITDGLCGEITQLDALSGGCFIQHNEDLVLLRLSELRIHRATVMSDWANRRLTVDKVIISSPPSMDAGIGTRSVTAPAAHIFSTYGFLVTSLQGDARVRLEKLAEDKGATVIHTWQDAIHFDLPKPSQKEWVLSKDHIKWQHSAVERLFLIADNYSSTPKYLMAIALGVPCINSTWLSDSVKSNTVLDWHQYLLPQGFSEHLNVTLTQTVDWDWGNEPICFDNLLDMPAPSKLLKGMSVLCVGSGMIPPPSALKITSPSVSDLRQSNHMFLPMILATMGAERVITVKSLNDTKRPWAHNFVIFREGVLQPPHTSAARAVTWEWMKNCLVAGRLAPVEA